jgi:EmrB/QacA subfamily drug resistance transporter
MRAVIIRRRRILRAKDPEQLSRLIDQGILEDQQDIDTEDADTGIAENSEKSSTGRTVIIGALMLAMLLAALDQTIVSTALPQIAADLNDLSQLSWVATAYLLTSAVATPIWGKLGDMYGRKKLFIVSIVIFLVGSALSGLSQNMDQLIIFRALQGIGGGGLMALILAIVADIIPPRQRGRYQGYFGAVFAVASVAGPLLGGLFTQHLSWHWIFYINIPLGLAALVMIGTKLHLPVHRAKRSIDYAGAGLLAIAAVSLLLVLEWGGVQYLWNSPEIIGLTAIGLIFTALFIWRERHAAEPIIPLRLFKSGIFNTSSLLSILVGIALFATILYIPQYQQIVQGESPTASGLLMLPLMLGIIATSAISGRLISKTGKYKLFPIIGGLLIAIGLWLFSHVGITTSHVILSLWMVVLGAGVGMILQVPTLVVQNSTEPKDLGSATATVTFFRNIGSTIGGAVFGTLLTSRLTYHIDQTIPAASGAVNTALSSGLTNLPAALKPEILAAYVSSFDDLFLYAIPFAAAAFAIALFLRETPLRDTPKETVEVQRKLQTT